MEVEGCVVPKQAFRWTNSPPNFQVSGQEALRAYFFPRQILQIQEAARIIGISREAIYKRQWRGDNSLVLRKFPTGRQYVLLEDLISYLFHSEAPHPNEIQDPPPGNCNGLSSGGKKRGRPRGSKNKV